MGKYEQFLQQALPIFQEDSRIIGIAVAKKKQPPPFRAIEYSDLTLTVVTEASFLSAVMEDKSELTGRIGHCLVRFPGERAESRREITCLMHEPSLLIHLKFCSLMEFSERIEDPLVLWEREHLLTETLKRSKPVFPQLDLQRLEDRFWVWIHQAASCLMRREIFATVDWLSFLRKEVLGPMILAKSGKDPASFEEIEEFGEQEYMRSLRATVPLYDARSCELSLKEAARLYVDLREISAKSDLQRHRRAEMAAMRCLHEVSVELERDSAVVRQLAP